MENHFHLIWQMCAEKKPEVVQRDEIGHIFGLVDAAENSYGTLMSKFQVNPIPQNSGGTIGQPTSYDYQITQQSVENSDAESIISGIISGAGYSGGSSGGVIPYNGIINPFN